MGCLFSLCACEICCCCACNLGCCAVSAGCSACECCGRSIPCSPSQKAKAWHSILFLLVIVFAWTVSVWASDFLGWIPSLSDASEECIDQTSSGNQNTCLNTLATYQVTWSLFAFHFFLTLLFIRVKETGELRARLHTSCWLAKFILFLGLLVSSFYISFTFFVIYKWFALVGAVIFIFLQLFLLIDFAHSLNELWVSNYDDTHSRIWVFALSGSTCVAYAFALTCIILSFIYYDSHWSGPFVTSLNLVFNILITALSLTPAIQKADRSTPIGILQSGIVSAYASFLVFSGLMSQEEAISSLFIVISGLILVFMSILSSTLSITSSEKTFLTTPVVTESTSLMDEEDETNNSKPVPYNYSFFQFTFAVASMYVCMLLTDWDMIINNDDPQSGIEIDHGEASMWIKVASSWVVCLFYIWTLVAPLIFPDRQW
jgi:serine incorporator 1/3